MIDIKSPLYGGKPYNLLTIWQRGVSIPRLINGWALIARTGDDGPIQGATYLYVPPRGVTTSVAMTAGQMLAPGGKPMAGLMGLELFESDDPMPGAGELAYRYFRETYEANPGMDVLDAWAEVKRRLEAGVKTIGWLATWGPVIGLGLVGTIGVLYGLSKVVK